MKKHERKDFLEIVSFNFEVGLWVIADWANFWSVFTNDDVAAVTANPDSVAVFREDLGIVDIFE